MIGNIGKGSEEAKKRVQALDASTMQMKPPELALPPKPQPKSTDPIEMWGSMAMVFAALASTRVRNHASTAMNAAAAAMNGFKQRDKEAYDQAFKTWEVETKNAIDLAHFQQESYKTLLASVEHKEDLAFKEGDAQDRATEAKIRAVSSALQDPAMVQALDHGGLAEATKLQEIREKQARDLKMYQIQMSKKGMEGQEVLAAQPVMQSPEYKAAMAKGDLATAYGLLATVAPGVYGALAEKAQKDKADAELKHQKDEESAGGQAKQAFERFKMEHPDATPKELNAAQLETYRGFTVHGRSVLPPISEENKPYLAEKLASYQIQPPSDSIMARSGDWVGVVKEAQKINPDYNPAKYKLVQQARQKITVGKDADTVASYVRLNQHLQFFNGLVDKLANGSDVKFLDGLAAAWGRQTGNANVSSYETALQLVGDEMVKAATGTGAAGALGDREEIKKNFDPALSKEQLHANIDAVRTLVGGAIVSTLNKYRSTLSPAELQNVTGLSPEDLESYHVDPKVLEPTIKGDVTLGGRTVKIDDHGVHPVASAAPQGGGKTTKEVKPGEFWTKDQSGKIYKSDKDGNPI
jgi:hypothetical protein